MVLSRRGLQSVTRRGRGFSELELAEVGLSLQKAMTLRLPIDPKRNTKHSNNVDMLKNLLEIAQRKDVEAKTT